MPRRRNVPEPDLAESRRVAARVAAEGFGPLLAPPRPASWLAERGYFGLTMPCPTCVVQPGWACRTRTGTALSPTESHLARCRLEHTLGPPPPSPLSVVCPRCRADRFERCQGVHYKTGPLVGVHARRWRALVRKGWDREAQLAYFFG